MRKRRPQCEWDHGGEMGRKLEKYRVQKDANETDQASNDAWDRNVGYNEATRPLD